MNTIPNFTSRKAFKDSLQKGDRIVAQSNTSFDVEDGFYYVNLYPSPKDIKRGYKVITIGVLVEDGLVVRIAERFLLSLGGEVILYDE